jgi:uncharacterized protein
MTMITQAFKSQLEIVNLVLERSADVNAKDKFGRTALMFAVRHGRLEVEKRLLQKGADVNAADDKGETALIKAVDADDNPDVVKLLLDKGADVNA